MDAFEIPAVRGNSIRRRELLGLLGGAAFLPLAASAQQPMPMIGFLHGALPSSVRGQVAAFWEGMEQSGFRENRNVSVEYSWAEGHHDLLHRLALDLVHQGAAVIVAGGSDNSIVAARQATETTPIVFVSGSDPVRSGFVESLNHPGGNTTGVSLAFTELLAKRSEILHTLAPQFTSIAALVNRMTPNIAVQLRYLADTAERTATPVHLINTSGETDFGAALDEIAKLREAALLVANDGFLNSQRDRLVALTTRYAIPAAFGNGEFVEVGGLMSYGPSLIAAYRQAGTYVGRILKGEKAAELPVQEPFESELVINLKTAKTLGLKIPPALLSAADELID